MSSFKTLNINGINYNGSQDIIINTRNFIFNAIPIENSFDGEGNQLCTANVSMKDILAAYNEGRTLICSLNGIYLNYIGITKSTDNDLMIFYLEEGISYTMISFPINDSSEVASGLIIISNPSFTIDDEVWYGDSSIDYTNTINNMIDTKISNIDFSQPPFSGFKTTIINEVLEALEVYDGNGVAY
jgi:hypothetical protein